MNIEFRAKLEKFMKENLPLLTTNICPSGKIYSGYSLEEILDCIESREDRDWVMENFHNTESPSLSSGTAPDPTDSMFAIYHYSNWDKWSKTEPIIELKNVTLFN